MSSIQQNLITRKTSDKVTRYGWVPEAEGALPVLQLKASDLKIDKSYQRDIPSEKAVMEIARNFKWAAFRTLLVGERPNGEFYVVDGQNRLRAAMHRGTLDVPCSVFQSSGPMEEAEIFYICSTKVIHITATNQYRARKVAGDSQILAIEAMLAKLGLEVSKGGSDKPCMINFPSCVVSTYSIDPSLTETALILQRAMVGNNECLNHYVHKGIFYILRSFRTSGPSITYEMALKVYKSGGKATLLNAINSLRAKIGGGTTNSVCGHGTFSVIKKSNRLRVELKGEAA